MKLFNFKPNSGQPELAATPDDRHWVESNLQWLIETYGYPPGTSGPVLFTRAYFPNTFAAEKATPETVVKDLAAVFSFDDKLIEFDIFSDIRNTTGIPYEIETPLFESALDETDTGYLITLNQELLDHQQRLISRLILECTKIKMKEDQVSFDTGNDTAPFIYLAGIFFDFGVLLAQQMQFRKQVYQQYWHTERNIISPMPDQVMAYALAVYTSITDVDCSSWIDFLPNPLRQYFGDAIILLRQNPISIYDADAKLISKLLAESYDASLKHDFKTAFHMLQPVTEKSMPAAIAGHVHNNLGYFLLRIERFEEALVHLHQSEASAPEMGYVYDNMAYAHIHLNQPEPALKALEKAEASGTNTKGYTLRNYALYYQLIADIPKAKYFFEQALKQGEAVDLLEYYYARFLLNMKEEEKAYHYLQIAGNKGEPEAISFLQTLSDGGNYSFKSSL